MKMDIVCCHPSGVALQLSLLSWRGIRGCTVGNENLLGVAPMGPDGAPRGIFHFWVLVGGASYCRSAQSDRASEIQDGGWTKHCTTSPSSPPFSYHVHFAPPPPPLPSPPPAHNIAAESDIIFSGDRLQDFWTRLAAHAVSLVQYYMLRGGGGE